MTATGPMAPLASSLVAGFDPKFLLVGSISSIPIFVSIPMLYEDSLYAVTCNVFMVHVFMVRGTLISETKIHAEHIFHPYLGSMIPN